MKNKFPLILAIAVLFISCTKKNSESISEKQNSNKERRKTDMVITSSAFREGEMIPSKHTCDGDDISPQLSWSGAPDRKSVV